MTKARIVLVSTVLLLVLGLVLAACSSATESASNLDGKALIDQRCTVCHGLQNITGARKSGDAWQSTVERMIGKGAQLNNAEKTAVVDYLTKTYSE